MKIDVREGDSFWYYSQLFNIPLQLIIDSNPDVSTQQLMVGTAINIPGFIKRPHTVDPGDTLWSIATHRRIALDALLLLNPDINPRKLKEGMTIDLPYKVTKPVVNGKQSYDFSTMVRDIKRLMALYPFIRQQSVGRSVEGKSLYELRVGQGSQVVHVNGSFHAREWISTPIIMAFLNDYLLALTNRETIRGLSMAPFYDNKTLSALPMVNPDGVDLVIHGLPQNSEYREHILEMNNGSTDFSQWKANIRGVDLNNQYPANWDIEADRKPNHPASANYPGPQPLSEPESQSLAQLTDDSSFERVIAFHTQGEVIYWGYLEYEPPETESIAQEFARVSNYEPDQNVDSHAGYKDWFEMKWQRPGFTIELGSGTSPLSLNQYEEIYQESLGVFLANLYL
ncbi:M14 family metallopeptidase [Tuberibacillus sp. Marseille-P3662]|uniref:M14 family metallopeptidase n=1 Tax=Tuberibacillus sp. Marseille-P3662 TaxID=1965358 RepID=UPI000A1C8736|nr:M14 family metallopeptidase [Tuberibacillus sp. Marseille-P3662]